MMLERMEQRVLGAIEFLDAISGTRVRDPLTVDAPDLTLTRNASALLVICDAKGLAAHTEAFDKPPATPAVESLPPFDITVVDPQRRYLPRTAQVKLPRKDAPVADPLSVLKPIAIRLYPTSVRAVDPLWAALRVFVFVTVDSHRIGVANALVRLTPSLAGATALFAVTDARGEALLGVTGVPPVMPASGSTDGAPNAVYTRNFSAALLVAVDDAVTRRGDSVLLPVPNPDDMQTRLAAANAAVHKFNPPAQQLSAGLVQRVEVEVTL
jgi:hypothetical protein